MNGIQRAKVCIVLVLVCASFHTQPETLAAPAPVELYRLLLEAQLKTQAADTKMIDCMTECSELLSRHYQRTKKLPQSLADFENIAVRTKLNGTKNPYFESELLARELPASTSHYVQFEVAADYGLSRNGLDACAKHPPKSWIGLPGSITIVHNSENLFAVRGYGMDGKPILNRTTNSAFYIFKECSESESD
ncbi:MAG: hypothetical protein JST89_10695 [Cyanobacteria bacterium SZAS-4]|nr:hypothetical protein [Cyanobacteria bacterium SZAS-4]